eukprot:g14516.t1
MSGYGSYGSMTQAEAGPGAGASEAELGAGAGEAHEAGVGGGETYAGLLSPEEEAKWKQRVQEAFKNRPDPYAADEHAEPALPPQDGVRLHSPTAPPPAAMQEVIATEIDQEEDSEVDRQRSPGEEYADAFMEKVRARCSNKKVIYIVLAMFYVWAQFGLPRVTANVLPDRAWIGSIVAVLIGMAVFASSPTFCVACITAPAWLLGAVSAFLWAAAFLYSEAASMHVQYASVKVWRDGGYKSYSSFDFTEDLYVNYQQVYLETTKTCSKKGCKTRTDVGVPVFLKPCNEQNATSFQCDFGFLLWLIFTKVVRKAVDFSNFDHFSGDHDLA